MLSHPPYPPPATARLRGRDEARIQRAKCSRLVLGRAYAVGVSLTVDIRIASVVDAGHRSTGLHLCGYGLSRVGAEGRDLMTTSAFFLSPAEAGAALGCSDETVRQMIRKGEIKFEKRGAHFKVPRYEVERLTGARLGPTEDEVKRQADIQRARELYAELGVVLSRLEA